MIEAARELARRSGHLAVVTLGREGALLVDGASELLAQPDVDGALVGGASLDPQGFAAIARAALVDE